MPKHYSFRPTAEARVAERPARRAVAKARQPWWSSLAMASALVAAAAGVSLSLPFPANAAAKGGVTASERAACEQRNRDDGTDLRACLKEMAAARAIRQSELTSPAAPTNAMDARCEPLPAAERDACRLRVRGIATTTTGSVSGGGVLRETREIVVGTPPAAAPTPR